MQEIWCYVLKQICLIPVVNDISNNFINGYLYITIIMIVALWSFSSISVLSLLNLINTLMKESNIYLQKHNVALFILISIISENR